MPWSGRRNASTFQVFEYFNNIVRVHCGFEAFVFGTELGAGVLSQGRDGKAADGREVADAIAVEQAMAVFVERDIHRPVSRVLDAPVCADDSCEMFRLWGQAAQIETRFIGLDVAAFDACEDDGQGSQARPSLAMRRVF